MRSTRRILLAAGHLARHIGRRGYTLLLLGLFDELYALSLPGLVHVPTPSARWLAFLLPLDLWAALWAATGVVLIVGAFRTRDEIAFAAATLLKATWATMFVLGWVFHGVNRGWVSAIVWTLLASWVLIISTWPEHPGGTRP